MTQELIKNYTLRISQANRSEIIVIVFELADRYLEEAISAAEADDADACMDLARHAMKCITHLMDALDETYELAGSLMSLYAYMNREIALASARLDADRLRTVQAQAKSLSESFIEIAKADASAPVMENSQTVYAGLTYGKGNLNESLYDEGSRRGFSV